MSGGVLFWVQHLLGSGHLRRTAALAHATAALGIEATIASGGMPLSHLDTGPARLVQLPPLRAGDAGFTALIDDRGLPAGDAVMAQRRALLEALVGETRPRVVVTETFPFGRRSLRTEVLALLAAAEALPEAPLVVASVRDILQRETRPDRIATMIETAQARYDAVLVHGDPALVRLEESFPAATLLGERVIHTGYIATGRAAARTSGGPGSDEVIVSVGGGAVGERLLAAAAAARPLSRLAAALTWRLLAGDAGLARHDLKPQSGLVIEPNRADFPALLANCAVSVSQAGYNTVTDLFAAGARAVLVPFAGQGETEQSERANHLARKGLAVVVAEDRLDPAALAAAVDEALALPSLSPGMLDLDGAAASARLLEAWVRHG